MQQEALESVQKVREGKAKIIQRSWRRYKVEKTLKMKDKAARCIQRNYRRHVKRMQELRRRAKVIERDIQQKREATMATHEEPEREDPPPLEPSQEEALPAPLPSEEVLEAESTAMVSFSSNDDTSRACSGQTSREDSTIISEKSSQPQEPLEVSTERVASEASTSVPKSDIEGDMLYEDFLKTVVEDLASQTFEDMLYQVSLRSC